MAKQPVRVQIFNQSYTLLADGDPREVLEIAHEIDELMLSISERSSSVDSTRVAVLACLHLADKLRLSEKQLKTFAAQSARISNLLEETLDPS